MLISLVVARAQNGVIGAKGTMPWHLSSDLKRFRKITMGKPIIMGGKTHRSIGQALAGRDNIVITRNLDALDDGVIGAADFKTALGAAKKCAVAARAGEIMVIGGGEIYRQALATADRIYLTEVKASPDGDVFFPMPDPARWREIEREDNKAGPNDSADFSFVVLERR